MKKTIAVLLAVLLAFSLALPAFAFPESVEGDARDNTYGIAKGYVRTKEAYQGPDGSSHVYNWSYNKQGKMTKEVESYKSEGVSESTSIKWTYDKKGNLIKDVYHMSDSVITDTFTNNSKGQVTKEERKIVYEDNSVYTSARFYTYNKAGKVVKELAYYDDCEEIKTYTYDKKGNVTKEVWTQSYEDNTRSKTTITRTYDKKGNELTLTMVDKDRYGSVEKRSNVSVYNKKNLCVKYTENWSYANDGETMSSTGVTTFAYDKKGNVTKEVFKSNDSDGYRRSVTTVNTYDAKGRVLKTVINEKSTEYSDKVTVTYTYNKKGLLVKEVTVSADGGSTDKTTETYAYDKAGNLTTYVYASSMGKSTTTYAYQKIGA